MIKIKLTTILMLFVAFSLMACEDTGVRDKFIPINIGTVANGAPSDMPTVITTAIQGNLALTPFIAGTSARGGGNVISEGSSAVFFRGLCWNTTGSPTIADSIVFDGRGPGVFINSNLTGLTANSIYYVKAYATNSAGTAYGAEISFNSGQTFGTDYAGGYLFYNDGNAHGLISAKSDQISQEWIQGGSTETTLNGNTSVAIGTGQTNTIAIMNQTGHTGGAAKVCDDYTDGTYTDWFLPSKDELNLMYTNLKVAGVGGFAGFFYWSSSEYDASNAWYQDFLLGSHIFNNKNIANRVRAARAF